MDPEGAAVAATGDASSAAVDRLEDQIAFYRRSATRKRRSYRLLSTAELVFAASVPAAAGLGVRTGVLGLLGAVAVVLQGVQHLFNSRSRYLAHQGTYERLRSEEALFNARAGEYRGRSDACVLLAERVEEIRQTETQSWLEEEQRRSAAGGGVGA